MDAHRITPGRWGASLSALLAMIVLLSFAAQVRANPVPLPAKFSQPLCIYPDVPPNYPPFPPGTIFGLDRLSQKPQPGGPPKQILADDFLALTSEPILGLRWWGSYINTTIQRPDSKVLFQVAFHDSNANGNPGIHPFSLPTVPLAVFTTIPAFEHFVGHDKFGEAVYVYEALLPQPFQQIPGHEYFLSIERHFDPQAPAQWGWHDTCHPFLDHSARTELKFGPWTTFVVPQPDPNNLEFTDLAFELLIPEPTAAVGLGLACLFLRRRGRRCR